MLLPFFLPVFLPVLAAPARKQASKAGHHISARLRPVNRKMAKLMQVQAVAMAW
jgi:hypothetical protein